MAPHAYFQGAAGRRRFPWTGDGRVCRLLVISRKAKIRLEEMLTACAKAYDGVIGDTEVSPFVTNGN